jgi:hypothetical protein
MRFSWHLGTTWDMFIVTWPRRTMPFDAERSWHSAPFEELPFSLGLMHGNPASSYPFVVGSEVGRQDSLSPEV